jgi:hypothetical protein
MVRMARGRQHYVVLRLIYSYILVIIASLVLSAYPILQQLFVVVWLILNGHFLWPYGKKHVDSFRLIIYTGILFQLPGFIAVVASLWSVLRNNNLEWGNGILELWVYPFLSFLELLPARHVGRLSEVYLSACLVPFVLTVTFISIRCWSQTRYTRNIR